MSKCICADWDNESHCPHHTPKLEQPSMVEHQCIVVRVYRRRDSKKWFYTTTSDGVNIEMSRNFEKKPKIRVTEE